MNKKLIAILFMMAPLAIFAQKFGHLNSADIIQVMPEYTAAQTELQKLEKQYSDELKMMETELSKKSEEYEAQKATLPANIQQRREQELQELYGRMQQYYQQSQQELAQASQEKMAALTEKITKAIKEVGVAGGYLYIFDVASGIPYISETLSTDVTAQVKAKLGIK
ncbi:MAG: OmpH family outer membrane protein [Bacteroidaceae bacterium]|nr:OmpH family outer membrane protein [Bacteroidaceae bacterium]MBQ7966645.1 OmpH family outer membrane protein [Bacteroidaceae bacterium]MBR4041393.1 OmpH family outer membrane protein [Bacteroidaceae bacterium]